jgi:uncharacterized membrane protein
MGPDTPASVEKQLEDLRSRVLRLEELLRDRGIAVPQHSDAVPFESAAPRPMDRRAPMAPFGPASIGTGSAPLAAQPLQAGEPPQFLSQQAKAADTGSRSLESRVGSQWFNRIGILAILIGMAGFLELAIDNHWIGPLGRVLIGLVAGAGLIVWSERFRSRGYIVFGYSLKAAGSGILYLSLWAAFSLYHLMPAEVAFAAMIAVTACNGFLSWVQNAELLALYAIVGGLSAPVLVSTGQNHEVTLFSYLLMLDAAVLVLVAFRPWSRLLFSAFLGTVIYVFGWWLSFYTNELLGRTAFFLLCFFLIFSFAPRLVRLTVDVAGGAAVWDHLVIGMLPIANAALGFIAFYELFDSHTAEKVGPWLAVAFAGFYLLILRLPETASFHKSPPLLSAIHLSTSVVFLTISLPLKAHGRWLTIGWLAEGAALLWTTTRVRSRLLGVLALFCFILGLSAVLVVNPDTSTTPFLNTRFATYCIAIAICGFVAWLGHRVQLQDPEVASLSWPAIAATSLLLVNLLVLLAVSAEIHSYWLLRHWSGNFRLLRDHQIYEQFSYSAFFMAFGALLLAIGFWRGSSFYRWQALILLAISVAKVFLVDVSTLSQGFRVLSFLGLGALLLAVSFVYQRDWLNLRSRGGQTP